MKKITFMIVAMLFSVTVFAQRGIPRTDNVSVSSTIITKKRTVVIERGFQQSVELGTKFLSGIDKGTTGVNYIGGYRFNNHFYAGAGIGLEFAHRVASGVREYVGGSVLIYSDSDYDSISDMQIRSKLGIRNSSGMDGVYGSLNLVSIPLYLHLKGYYTETKWAPYSSLSLGGVLAPKENGLYVDFSTGVDVRFNDKINIYFAAGVWYRKVRNTWLDEYRRDISYCDGSLCGLGRSHCHNTLSNLYCNMVNTCGLSLRVGVSF